MIAALLVIAACTGVSKDSGAGPADTADTSGTPDVAVCGEGYLRSELLADIRGPYCEWVVDCLGIFDDAGSCGEMYTGETFFEGIDPCRIQTCAAWLASDAYVCETEEPVATPSDCLDPFVQEG